MRKYTKPRPGGQVSRNAYQLEITSSCNGCSEEPLAPIVVHPEVVSSAEILGHLEAECTNILRVPSSFVRCTCLAGVGRGKVGERTCSAALDELGKDACETVAEIRSPSSEVAHQTFFRGCSLKGKQVRGLVHWECEETGEGQDDCSLLK